MTSTHAHQPSQVLDGVRAAAHLEQKLRERVDALRVAGVQPTLNIIFIGGDPASTIFVQRKRLAAKRLGIVSHVERLEATASANDAHAIIEHWNTDKNVHAILLQHPLPSPHDARALGDCVHPKKDVDGLHPENLGLLARGTPRIIPPTAAGIQQLLVANNIQISGKHVVIVGRGHLVGMPLTLLLSQKSPDGNATVTLCHQQTQDLPAITKTADILVAAAGSPLLINETHVREGTVIVDTGIHHTPNGLVGDVDYARVAPIVSALTPVPGGVGPMTVIMALNNVVDAAERLTETPKTPIEITS